MPYHGQTDKPKMDKRRKLTEKEKMELKKHHDLVPHSKSQKMKMMQTMTSSSKKYETKASLMALHKRLFGK